jgi:lysyl-tRNA synthetase class 2
MIDKKVPPEEETVNRREGSGKTDQEASRQIKVERLSREGIDLFPHNVKTTHSASDIVERFSPLSKEELEEKKVIVIVHSPDGPGHIFSYCRQPFQTSSLSAGR